MKKSKLIALCTLFLFAGVALAAASIDEFCCYEIEVAYLYNDPPQLGDETELTGYVDISGVPPTSSTSGLYHWSVDFRLWYYYTGVGFVLQDSWETQVHIVASSGTEEIDNIVLPAVTSLKDAKFEAVLKYSVITGWDGETPIWENYTVTSTYEFIVLP